MSGAQAFSDVANTAYYKSAVDHIVYGTNYRLYNELVEKFVSDLQEQIRSPTRR